MTDFRLVKITRDITPLERPINSGKGGVAICQRLAKKKTTRNCLWHRKNNKNNFKLIQKSFSVMSTIRFCYCYIGERIVSTVLPTKPPQTASYSNSMTVNHQAFIAQTVTILCRLRPFRFVL